jgi:hypothetical protein
MLKDIDNLRKLMMMNMIPKEMFWAYESVRQSGLYNMCCIIPSVGRYAETSFSEMIKLMDDVYIRYCAYNEVDLDDANNKDIYKHVTLDHARLIQELYSDLLEAHGMPPKDVVKIKKNVEINLTF